MPLHVLPQSNYLIQNFSRVLFHFDVDAPTEAGLCVALLQTFCEPLTAKKFSNSISKKFLSANTPEFNPIVATNQRCITLTRSIALLTYAAVIDRIRRRDFPKMEKATVKVSPKFQVVIPKLIREELKIEPGQELMMYALDGSLRLVPHRSVRELKGIAKGMRWKEDYRDHSERF